MNTDIMIFNVGMGQSIFVYPRSNPEYGMLIDCGNTEGFEPIDFLIERGFVRGTLKTLVLTNYDQDHFSGLPYLRNKVKIESVRFPRNLTSTEIKGMKERPHTEALEHICDIKDKYTADAVNHNPPYKVVSFHLEGHHLENPTTNDLSQLVFIEHHGSVLCVAGDLEQKGWETLLRLYPDIKKWLAKTNMFVASHHGRANGYFPDIFSYCKPECIVISDKEIVHGTQEAMSSVYGKHVSGNGIVFGGNFRKVLTTRDDGHIYIQWHPAGTREYRNLN